MFVFARYNWWNDILPIRSIDRQEREITLASDASYAIRPGDRYFVQNLREELDSPGEWWLDKKTWTLYFWPPKPLAGHSVCVPTLGTILELGPDTAHVVFRGFTFGCCDGTAVTLIRSRHCLIAGNTICDVGGLWGGGVSVHDGFHNGVIGNDISWVGANGISLSGGDRKKLQAAENYADNNYIHHVGVLWKSGVGIDLQGVGNRASHNLIHDGPRIGIEFSGNNLVIEYNEIRHMNLETDDSGAIYTGGRDWISSRGSVIRYNYLHDMIGWGANFDRREPPSLDLERLPGRQHRRSGRDRKYPSPRRLRADAAQRARQPHRKQRLCRQPLPASPIQRLDGRPKLCGKNTSRRWSRATKWLPTSRPGKTCGTCTSTPRTLSCPMA